jgi:hypothetical protein
MTTTLQELQTQLTKVTTVAQLSTAVQSLVQVAIQDQAKLNSLQTKNTELKQVIDSTKPANIVSVPQIVIDQTKLPEKPSDSWSAPQHDDLNEQISQLIDQRQKLLKEDNSEKQIKDIDNQMFLVGEEVARRNQQSFEQYQKAQSKYQYALEEQIKAQETTFNIIK